MVANGDLVEAVIYGDAGSSDRFLNVLGFVSLGTAGTFAGLASGLKTAIVKNTSGGVLFGASNVYGIARIVINAVYPASAASYDYTFTRVAGSDSSVAPGSFTNAVCIKWGSAFSGRSNRGRSFITGFPTSAINAGIWTSTIQTNMAAFVTNLLAVYGPGGSDGNWQFSIISRRNGGVARPNPVGVDVTSGTVGNVVRQQRRREIGVGG